MSAQPPENAACAKAMAQLAELADRNPPDGSDLLHALRAAGESPLPPGGEREIIARLASVRARWSQTQDGLNELAFALVAQIEEPEDAPQVVQWLLDAGVPPMGAHVFAHRAGDPCPEPERAMDPLLAAIERSWPEAIGWLQEKGARPTPEHLQEAVFRIYCKENQGPAHRDAEDIERAYAIAFKLGAASEAFLRAWEPRPGGTASTLDWAACCARGGLMAEFFEAARDGLLQLPAEAADQRLDELVCFAAENAHTPEGLAALFRANAPSEALLARAVLCAVKSDRGEMLRFLLDFGASDKLADDWANGRPNKALEEFPAFDRYLWKWENAERGVQRLRAWQEAQALARVAFEPAASPSSPQLSPGRRRI